MSKRRRKSSRARARARRNVVADASRSRPGATEASQDQSTHPEYAHVSRDLRRVTILAAAIFVLLIALSFFIG